MRGRLRSKKTRERRKEYVAKLEERIKKLEEENFRLQNLLMNYRKENFENIGDIAKPLVQSIDEHRIKVAEKVDSIQKENGTHLSQEDIHKEFKTITDSVHERFK